MIRNEVTSVIQTNTGIRNSVMPGRPHVQNRHDEVEAPASEAMPRICRPRTQKSMPWPGENSFEVSGA